MTTTRQRRARKQPAEIRRETVLDAAIRVFARQSYRAAGTAEIAREAGIAEPTIYRYFASKRDLYLAALHQTGEVVYREFARIAERQPIAALALNEMGEWYEESVLADPDHLRLRMRAIAETDDPEIQARIREIYLRIHALVEGLIRRGQQDGVLQRGMTASGAAWMFLAVGQILDLTRLLGIPLHDVAQICDDVSSISKQAMLGGTPPPAP